MKKILTLILCICCVILCGCQTAPQYILEQDKDGNITQTIYIPYTAREMMTVGLDLVSATEIANNLKAEFDAYFINKYLNFETKLAADPDLTAEEKLEIKSLCPTVDEMKGKGQIFGTSDKSGILYEINYKSIIAYYYFNMSYNYNKMIEELNKDDSITKQHLFSRDVVNSGISIYGQETDLAEDLTFAEYLTKTSRDILKTYGLNDAQVEIVVPKEYVYRYGTTQKRLHSNADNIFYADGIYYHEWTFSVEDSTREIITWKTYANTTYWYILAVGITVVLIGVMFTYCFIKEKLGKKELTENKED